MKTNRRKDPSRSVVRTLGVGALILAGFAALFLFYPKAEAPAHHDWAPLVAKTSPPITPKIAKLAATKPVVAPVAPYTDERADLLEQINAARAAAGVAPLTRNLKLDAAAQAKADAETQLNFFAHDDPDGAAPWHYIAEAGYVAGYEGENLSKDYSADQVVAAWIASPTHYANIIKASYTQTGFAIEGPYIVEYFASPASL